jgi:hypothetical protein
MASHDDQNARRMPTPRQIRAEAAAIRRGWDEKTRHRRQVTDDLPVPWTVPEVTSSNTSLPGVQRKLSDRVDGDRF